MILTAAINKESKANRDITLFDAFDSITGYAEHQTFLSVREQCVRDGFESFSLLDANIRFETGLFSETLPKFYLSRSVKA